MWFQDGGGDPDPPPDTEHLCDLVSLRWDTCKYYLLQRYMSKCRVTPKPGEIIGNKHRKTFHPTQVFKGQNQYNKVVLLCFLKSYISGECYIKISLLLLIYTIICQRTRFKTR